MVKKRIITALGIITLFVVLVWLGKPWWFTILVAIWGLLAVFEFYKMAATPKMPILTYFGLIWTLLFIITPHFDYDFLIPLLLTSSVILPLIWLLLRPQKEGALITWAWTIAGILYVGWLLSYFVALRELDSGRVWVSLAVFTTSGSDTTAFFVGRAMGRHKLAPSISPGKTWEGAIAGVIGAIAVSLLLVTIFSLPIGYGQAILLGSIVSIFSQIGDLAESLLKRNVGVKDSGKLIPGHGGFLDRIDSIVFTGIVVYYYVIWVIL